MNHEWEHGLKREGVRSPKFLGVFSALSQHHFSLGNRVLVCLLT